MFDFYRVATIVPDLKVANVHYNKDKIAQKLTEAFSLDAGIIAFPELAVTGYTCQDLFFQKELIDESMNAISELLKVSAGHERLVIIGAPVIISNRLYNGAFVIFDGELLGITIKTYIPEYNEFYEKRWFDSADDLTQRSVSLHEIGISIDEDYVVSVGKNIVYKLGGVSVGVEICEDMFAPVSPSSLMAMGDAEVIVNISASNELISKREYRRNLVRQISSTNICDYVYVSAGSSESTQDLIFSGHCMIVENGVVVNENTDYIANDYIMIADIDLGKIRHDRLKNKSFSDCARYSSALVSTVRFLNFDNLYLESSDAKYINPDRYPFIPAARNKRVKRCMEIFEMQTAALAQRLKITGAKAVVGVSGGMDSTLALLVAANAMKMLKRPYTDLVGISMPAFGTTDRTYKNAIYLIEALGAKAVTIDIKESCLQHMKDIGHDENKKDVTYENVQARERTQVLMDYSNRVNGLVVGTGDLSELCLGWCTYNGDQMSMYGVNADIPKTLVRWILECIVEEDLFPDCSDIIKDILDTPISPELLPPDEDDNITQKTEEKIGPYELHDFFIYYTLRYGYSPKKIFFLASQAFSEEEYTESEIKRWLKVFYNRFFTQQFKRSCMPDGVKIGTVSVSPRGDLRMPTDAGARIWIDELD